MGGIDVMLREKEERFWCEGGAAYLPVWKQQSESVGTVEQVLVGGLL